MPTDFGSYPPEVNSLRMYTGPGPGPMLAAAQAWDAVADEMYTAASGFQSTVSELTATAWSGPSSEAMVSAAERHIRWLGSTAAHAEHTAARARIAAAAFEAAFVSTVPPPEVAANRSLLAMLVATNVLGVNTPAIAATEALYAEMWAQDALAMYTYAGSSAAAVALPPFESADGIVGDLDGPISLVPQALSALAASEQGELLSPLASLIAILINSPGDFAAIFVLAPVDALTGFAEVPPAAFTTLSGLEDDDSFSHNNGEEAWPGEGPAPLWPFPPTLTNPPAGVLTAALGEANVVGALSVPPSWPVDAAEVRPVALATPLTAGTALEVEAAMVGQAMAAPPPVAEQAAAPVTHTRPKAPRPVVTGVVAAIREIARQRAEGLLSDAEYDERKTEVLDGAMDARASELIRVERATGIEPA